MRFATRTSGRGFARIAVSTAMLIAAVGAALIAGGAPADASAAGAATLAHANVGSYWHRALDLMERTADPRADRLRDIMRDLTPDMTSIRRLG